MKVSTIESTPTDFHHIFLHTSFVSALVSGSVNTTFAYVTNQSKNNKKLTSPTDLDECQFVGLARFDLCALHDKPSSARYWIHPILTAIFNRYIHLTVLLVAKEFYKVCKKELTWTRAKCKTCCANDITSLNPFRVCTIQERKLAKLAGTSCHSTQIPRSRFVNLQANTERNMMELQRQQAILCIFCHFLLFTLKFSIRRRI